MVNLGYIIKALAIGFLVSLQPVAKNIDRPERKKVIE
jgi:hypothetical protein